MVAINIHLVHDVFVRSIRAHTIIEIDIMFSTKITNNPNHPKGYFWCLTTPYPHPCAGLLGDDRANGRRKIREAQAGIPNYITTLEEAEQYCKVANVKIDSNWFQFFVTECSPL